MPTPALRSAPRTDRADPRVLRLWYNRAFLPEYLSTIVISIVISVPFLLVPVNGGPRLDANPHAPFGLGTYIVIVFALARITFRHRLDYRQVRVIRDPDDGILVRSGRAEIRLQKIDHGELRIDRFFGRRVRALHLRDIRGHELVVHDAIDGFSELLRLVRTLVGESIETAHGYDEIAPRVAEAWADRHTLFPLTVEGTVSRGLVRFFFLIPVAFVDLLSNLWLNFQLVATGHPDLIVYAAPLTLLLAALVNRYVSYYMLTSRRMNQ